MIHKVCVIGVYFGVLPKYFSLWMKACTYNPDIDFFVFCDQAIDNAPENVKVFPMTLKEVKLRAEKVLGFPVRLEQAYKCCDYKAIYGLVFSDYVAEYDYWGHCDFDLIFGDLQNLMSKHEFYNYDRYLTLGHLSLYRNTEAVNRRYMSEGSLYDYRHTYTTDQICVFDELPGMTAIYQKNNFSMFTDRVFADIASIYHRYRVIDEYPLDVKPENYKEQIFYWERGKTYRAFFLKDELHKEEYVYIHFKKRPNFDVTFEIEEVDAFYITNTGFYPKEGEVTRELIHQLNPYPGKLTEIYEKGKFWVQKKIAGAKRRFIRKHR